MLATRPLLASLRMADTREAISRAFIARTRGCGIGGPALTIAYAFGALLDSAPFPDTGLRHWAQILTDAADLLEGKSGEPS
jgi:hypothetical protein